MSDNETFKVKAANLFYLNSQLFNLSICLIPSLYLTVKLKNKIVFREFNSHFNSPSNLLNRINVKDFYKDSLCRTGILLFFNFLAMFIFCEKYADREVKEMYLKQADEELKLEMERENKTIEFKSRLNEDVVDIVDSVAINRLLSTTHDNIKSRDRMKEYSNNKNN